MSYSGLGTVVEGPAPVPIKLNYEVVEWGGLRWVTDASRAAMALSMTNAWLVEDGPGQKEYFLVSGPKTVGGIANPANMVLLGLKLSRHVIVVGNEDMGTVFAAGNDGEFPKLLPLVGAGSPKALKYNGAIYDGDPEVLASLLKMVGWRRLACSRRRDRRGRTARARAEKGVGFRQPKGPRRSIIMRQYYETSHYGMPYQNVMLSGFGTEPSLPPAHTTDPAGIRVLVPAAVESVMKKAMVARIIAIGGDANVELVVPAAGPDPRETGAAWIKRKLVEGLVVIYVSSGGSYGAYGPLGASKEALVAVPQGKVAEYAGPKGLAVAYVLAQPAAAPALASTSGIGPLVAGALALGAVVLVGLALSKKRSKSAPEG